MPKVGVLMYKYFVILQYKFLKKYLNNIVGEPKLMSIIVKFKKKKIN